MKTILTIGPNGNPITGQYIAFKSYVANTRLEVKTLTYSGGASLLEKLKSNVFFIFSLFFCILKNRPLVIYFTSSRSLQGFVRDLFIVFFGSLFNAKLVNHLHGADFKPFYNESSPALKKIIDWVYRKINVSIVLSDLMSEQYERYAKTMRVEAVSNCYLPSGAITAKIEKNEHTLNILYLSNLMHSKGVLELVDAVKAVSYKGSKIKLKVAGSFVSDHVSSGAHLEKMFFGKINEDIEYLGTVRGDKKNQLLEWADCLALPTYYPTEAQPICVIEAMAAGCFIISTEHNYMPDLVKPENGILVKPQSVSELEDALKAIAENPDRLEKVKAFNKVHAEKNFSLERYVSRIDSIISQLMK